MEIEKKNIIQKLRTLGFSDAEAKIYVELVQHQSLSMSVIAKRIGLKRTSLYPLISKLLSRGIVQKIIHGKRFLYQVSDAEEFFERTIQEALETKQLIQAITPTIDKHDSLTSEMITSKDQLFTFLNRILRLKKGAVVYSIEGAESIETLGDSFHAQELHWQAECSKRGIVLKGVGTHRTVKQLLEHWPREVLQEMTERSVAPRLIQETELPQFGILLVAYENKVLIAVPQRGIGVFIGNQTIANSFKNLIDFVYLHGEYVNLNKLIERKITEQ